MEPNKIFDILTSDIITGLGLPPFSSHFIHKRITWAFVAGQDSARIHRKEVIQIDPDGTFIRSWDNPKQAGIAMGVDPSGISKAASSNNRRLTSAGFKWEYAEDYHRRIKWKKELNTTSL